MSTAALKLTGVEVKFADVRVVGPLDLEVRQGGYFVIIGPNGSGKTTLLRAMAGLVKAAGRVEILGSPLVRVSRSRLACTAAYLAQFQPEDLPFTVYETVLLGRAPRLGLFGGEGQADREAAERAMVMAKVEHLRERKLSRLSGGERKRVFIAQALCREPDILLFDEPTANLDPAHQIMIMDLLETLRRERGNTVITVSHDLNLAAMYADRLLLMKDGRATAVGTPDEVFTNRTLTRAYGWELFVDENPLTGTPRVTPVPATGPGRENSKS